MSYLLSKVKQRTSEICGCFVEWLQGSFVGVLGLAGEVSRGTDLILGCFDGEGCSDLKLSTVVIFPWNKIETKLF